MNSEQLYNLLELPDEIVNELKEYDCNRNSVLNDAIKEMLLKRESWEKGVRTLQESVGPDKNGIKILWEMLNIACESYEEYERKNIPHSIFVDTMKFCTRFIKEHYYVNGEYRFEWAWWFPRQLALKEFRIGCLEYEFVEMAENIISVHIPSDADFQPKRVFESFRNFFSFRKRYFPQWENSKIYCESWLLSPVLKELLDDNSNIIRFQNCFVVETTDYDSMAVLDWVFPGYKDVSVHLPENTSLQKKMKNYLLQGGKIGWSKGYLKESCLNYVIKVL